MVTILVSPGESIQDAINAAVDGDIIIVSPGVYAEILTISDKNITLASEFYTTGNPDVINQTIINGVIPGREGSDIITVSESSDTQIIGFTFFSGDDGIQVDDSSNIEIANNRIINTIDAIDFKGNSSGVIRDNILEYNLDDGVDLNSEAVAIIENNIIRNNDGDGLEMRLQPYTGSTLEVIIRDNLITDNLADGLQFIGYDVLSDRYIRIEGNLIKDNRQAGVGLMDNEETNEDYRAASLPEPIDVINNTFIGNNHGLTGGDNLVAINNLFVDHTNIAMKGVDGNSIAAYNLFWNNGLRPNLYSFNILL